MVKATSRPLYLRERETVSIAQESGWAPGSAWTGAENLAPLGFDPRTVQPIASRYCDYASPAHILFLLPVVNNKGKEMYIQS